MNNRDAIEEVLLNLLPGERIVHKTKAGVFSSSRSIPTSRIIATDRRLLIVDTRNPFKSSTEAVSYDSIDSIHVTKGMFPKLILKTQNHMIPITFNSKAQAVSAFSILSRQIELSRNQGIVDYEPVPIINAQEEDIAPNTYYRQQDAIEDINDGNGSNATPTTPNIQNVPNIPNISTAQPSMPTIPITTRILNIASSGSNAIASLGLGAANYAIERINSLKNYNRYNISNANGNNAANTNRQLPPEAFGNSVITTQTQTNGHSSNLYMMQKDYQYASSVPYTGKEPVKVNYYSEWKQPLTYGVEASGDSFYQQPKDEERQFIQQTKPSGNGGLGWHPDKDMKIFTVRQVRNRIHNNYLLHNKSQILAEEEAKLGNMLATMGKIMSEMSLKLVKDGAKRINEKVAKLNIQKPKPFNTLDGNT
ncbi:MAG: PH domain-containing protein [Candidatus Marsarchaeota archaeon]|nr:PH domain-containing protein [Candidatus Marsarchaeota archaeon]